MKKLLVCIPFHDDGSGSRLPFFKKVIENILNTYEMDVHIMVNTNSGWGFWYDRVDFFWHHNLAHPFHLTWVSRKQIADNIDNYDYVYQVEDDMLLPWKNFKNYIETFDKLWPAYIPGLIRVETGPDGKLYNTDAQKQQVYHNGLWVTDCDENRYTSMDYPYHAQWIMPREALKSSMRANFVRLEDNRELAASYPLWELNKTALVRLTNDNQIDPLCYTYHLPNNYAMSPDSPFGKIEVNKLFI